MKSLGWHLFGIAYVKEDFFALLKMYVMLELEGLALNYTICTNEHIDPNFSDLGNVLCFAA